MKLIKLVYLGHGWHLAFLGRPLIREPIQAWKYGPVIESLYHGFKHRGNSRIPKEEIDFLPSVGIESEAEALIDKVWTKYSPLTATQLSSLTHQPGTPWYQVWWDGSGRTIHGTIIPDEMIRKFYQSKLEPNSGSGH